MDLFVGNLPQAADEAQLKKTFGQFGAVTSAAVVRSKNTGDSRGFGFVKMPDQAEAESAIGKLHGKEMSGQVLKVRQAKSREDRIENAYEQALSRN